MTKRENYTRVLTGRKAERLPFVPNFDYWLEVNRQNNTLPKKYRDMGRNDIVRAINGTIWARTYTIEEKLKGDIKISRKETGSLIITDYQTPIGSVQTVHQYADDFTRALFLKEHRIKRREDIKVVKYLVEHSCFVLDRQTFIDSENDVADDGISLLALPYCLPYIQFGKNDAGWERGLYLFADYPEDVEELMEVYAQKNMEAAALLAGSPGLVVASGDNMDEWTTPPNVFCKYAIPYYRKIAGILHRSGKILEGHWCGRTEHLLQFVPECGIDVVEAISVQPMAKLTIPEALDLVGDHVVIQGGIPSVLLCPQSGRLQDLRDYLKDLLPRVPHGYRFALGMSDNVPPDADFSRVEMIAEMVDNYHG